VPLLSEILSRMSVDMSSVMRISCIHFDTVTYAVQQDSGECVVILNKLSLAWHAGTFVTLEGMSGSGKSTLLSIAAGLLYPTSGAVWYGDTRLEACHEALWREMRSRHIGYVFQAPLLIPELSVLENVMTRALVQGRNLHEVRDEAYALLQRLKIEAVALKNPLALSGGEQQRVSLARALMGRPSFLILDEPTLHLDARTRDHFIDLLNTLRSAENIGIVIATHEEKVSEVADEVWILEAGTLQRKR
jgi:putative ABC transport system ATP-binding protein